MDSGSQLNDAGRMGVKLFLMPKLLLAALLVLAMLIGACVFVPLPMAVRRQMFPLVAGLALLFAVLGIALIVVGARMHAERTLRAFLILTGSCASGILVCAVLHNVVYGLMIHWFGAGIWDRLGLPDEPVFFVLALFVCPALFFVGEIGSIVLFLRKKMQPPMTPSV